jgi:hypothetical protein
MSAFCMIGESGIAGSTPGLVEHDLKSTEAHAFVVYSDAAHQYLARVFHSYTCGRSKSYRRDQNGQRVSARSNM